MELSGLRFRYSGADVREALYHLAQIEPKIEGAALLNLRHRIVDSDVYYLSIEEILWLLNRGPAPFKFLNQPVSGEGKCKGSMAFLESTAGSPIS